MAEILHQEDSEQTSRMAMAIIANAMVYHFAIAGPHNLPELPSLRGGGGRLNVTKVYNVWNRILREINYWPIFKIASELLLCVPVPKSGWILDGLVEAATELAQFGAVSMHDLSGRMFQRLIADRKFLATFYTLPNSAALLAGLAVARLRVDWADPASVKRLRLADLACGTGALLGAAYQCVLARHRRAGGDDAQLHGAMMERALIAADIMPAATHLTASLLSSAHPGVTFRQTQIYTMPYGEAPEGSGRRCAIGSLDLIDSDETRALFGTAQRQTWGDRSDSQGVDWSLPAESLDLVIMNPPFTRPTNHESATVPVPSFAGFGTSAEEQSAMAERLKEVRRSGRELAGHGNAGLASNFIDLAHAKVKPGGVVALVLPASFTQGESWKAARRLFDRHYRDLTIISIAEAESTGRAFSADTGMAEVLVVATKREPSQEQAAPAEAAYVNLDRRPGNLLEARELARGIARGGLAVLANESGSEARCRLGVCTKAALGDGGAAQLRHPGLVAAMLALRGGHLRLPRQRKRLPIRVVRLGALGARGLLHRDIAGAERAADGLPRGPFDVEPVRGASDYPMLWAHDAPRERCLVVQPDREGVVRPGCEERAAEVWERTATRLHFTLDFRINSQSLVACLTPKPSIGGTAWPNFRLTDSAWDEAVALWANTTLGVMGVWWLGTRQQQGRARLTISRLPELVVLDPRALTEEQLDRCGKLFEAFRARPLKPANEAFRCETRQALDRALLVDLLGLPERILEPLGALRDQWCDEPTVHGGKSTRINRCN